MQTTTRPKNGLKPHGIMPPVVLDVCGLGTVQLPVALSRTTRTLSLLFFDDAETAKLALSPLGVSSKIAQDGRWYYDEGCGGYCSTWVRYGHWRQLSGKGCSRSRIMQPDAKTMILLSMEDDLELSIMWAGQWFSICNDGSYRLMLSACYSRCLHMCALSIICTYFLGIGCQSSWSCRCSSTRDWKTDLRQPFEISWDTIKYRTL